MAKSRSQNKDRLIEALILVFVVVSVTLLVIQLGTNVADTLEQSRSSADEQAPQGETVLTPAPPEPAPTIGLGTPASDTD